jgi:hypothetical protein
MRGPRVAGAAFVLGLAAGAAGFVQSVGEPPPGATEGRPLSWPTNLVAFTVNPTQPHASPSCTGDAAHAVVRASFAAWEQSCSSLDLVDGGTIQEIRTGLRGSGENLVVFRQGWCRARLPANEPCLNDPDLDCGGIHNCFEDASDADRFTLALTSVLYRPDTGRIENADIEVNGWDGEGAGTDIRAPPPHGWYFTCNEPTGAPCTTYGQDGCHFMDLQATVTHEVGHVIGLRHVCDPGAGGPDAGLPPCNASHEAITMNPSTGVGDIEKRTLHPDDVAGVCAIYPSGSSSSGGCGTGGGSGALAALLAATALARMRRRG